MKHSIILPKDAKFSDFAEEWKFQGLQRFFYKQNILGFSENDINENILISVNEFDTENPNDDGFCDTAPEIKEKEIVEDFLKPLINKIYRDYKKDASIEFERVLRFGKVHVLYSRDKRLEHLNYIKNKITNAKYLAGVKLKILQYLDKADSDVKTIFNIDALEKPETHKIELSLKKTEVAQLLTILNKLGLFKEVLTQPQLASMATIHFKYKSVGNFVEFNHRNISQELSRAFTNHSITLSNLFKDYQNIFKEITDEKKTDN